MGRPLILILTAVLLTLLLISGAVAAAEGNGVISNQLQATVKVLLEAAGDSLKTDRSPSPVEANLDGELAAALRRTTAGEPLTVTAWAKDHGYFQASFSAVWVEELAANSHPLVLKGQDVDQLVITLSPTSLDPERVRRVLQQNPAAQVVIRWRHLSETERQVVLAARAGQEGGGLFQAGDVYRLAAFLGSEGLDGFDGTVVVDFPVPAGFDPEEVNLIGVYRLVYDAASGSFGQEFVPSVPFYDEGDGRWWVRAELDRFSLFTLFTYKKTFADIQGHWARKAIETLAARHVVQGIDGTHFSPGSPVTRAQFAAMLVRAMNIKAHSPGGPSFRDVPEDAWYFLPVEAAWQAGLVKGTGAGKFEPNAPMTRQEMAVLVSRAIGPRQPAVSSSESAVLARFQDWEEIAPWAREAAARVVQQGLITGLPNGRFAPREAATRAQAAVVLVQMLRAMGRII